MAEIDPEQKDLEQAARKTALRDLQQELTPLCCIVRAVGDKMLLRRCIDCESYMCEEHINYIGRYFRCSRCVQVYLLFPDLVGAPDANTERQEVSFKT